MHYPPYGITSRCYTCYRDVRMSQVGWFDSLQVVELYMYMYMYDLDSAVYMYIIHTISTGYLCPGCSHLPPLQVPVQYTHTSIHNR